MLPALDTVDRDALGKQLMELITELYPICRSITGDGVRKTLRLLERHIPLTTHQVPSNTKVFDWTVPLEWNIRDAYIKDSQGHRVVDFHNSNLHVVSYSVPTRQKMRLADLKPHLFTLPDHPDWIPYRTSYYNKTWGFCLTHNQLCALADDEYEVCIDSSLEPGYLTYGEMYLPGETEEEILISTHVCHPSLANDNLSGIAIACFLADHVSRVSHRYSFRFLFIPGTIGAIAWLCRNERNVSRTKHGLVLTGLGDSGHLCYKKSRKGDTEIDRAAAHVLRRSDPGSQIVEFSPYGYDERQYCSPAFDLAVGRLSRTPHGTFPQYHTSADDLSFVSAPALVGSFSACASILSVLDRNRTYLNLSPRCEPQLGERGLYRLVGGPAQDNSRELALLWVLNLCDGKHSLLDIAERSQLSFECIQQAAAALQEHDLLRDLQEELPPVVTQNRS